jgi:hypothetical protein
MMMPPYYHPTYHSDVSSIDDSSSGEENSCDHEEVKRDVPNPIDLRIQHTSDYFYHNIENCVPVIRQIRNNNNASSRPSKRANVGDIVSYSTEDHADLPVLQPSQAENVTGNCNTHAMKGVTSSLVSSMTPKTSCS